MRPAPEPTTRSGGRILAIALLVVILAGCGSAVPSTQTPAAVSPVPVSPAASPAFAASPHASVGAASASPSAVPSPLSRDEGWRADIDALLEVRERLHPDPWHGLHRATWVSAADAVKSRVPALTDDQALVELIRLATMPGLAGRDGHTGVFPFIPGSGTHEYPIRLWQFSDGLLVTDARAPYEDLVGSRIEAIAGRPIEEVLKLVNPLAPRDNPSTVLAYAPLYLRVSEVLAGLGIIDRAGPATFTVVAPSGSRRDVSVEPISAEDDIAWHGGNPTRLPAGKTLLQRDMANRLWWSYLPDSRTLYVQYNEVMAPVAALADEILDRAKRPDVDRVVVDLRNNGGGDNTTYRHLLEVLQDPAIDRPGRLTALIGRLTFSAAANFATDLETTTNASFAGESMGGSPNLYGDARPTELPYGAQTIYMATVYWMKTTVDDPRVTIEPDLAIPVSSKEYLAGLDPVLAAVIAGRPAR